MSHFIVAVFTKDGEKSIEELLAPYHEFECTGIDDQYVQEIDATENLKKTYNETFIAKYKNSDGKLYSKWEDEFYRDPTSEEQKKLNDNDRDIPFSRKDWGDGKGERIKVRYIPEGYEEVEVFIKDTQSFEEYIEGDGIEKVSFGEDPDLSDKHKYSYFTVDENNKVLKVVTRTNPNSEWDGYQTGGRWSGLLKLKKDSVGKMGEKSWTNAAEETREGFVDSAKIKDIDFSIDKESKEYQGAIIFWELAIEGRKPENENEENILKFNIYKKEYYTQRYKNKEEYAIDTVSINSYAVITPDGKWHSKGKMGWFGSSSENEDEFSKWSKSYYDAFIKNADPELTMTIVDCHI